MTPLAAIPTEIYAIVSTLLGGGFFAVLINMYKARPERDNIVISGAANAQEIFKGLNEALYAELEREREKYKLCNQWNEVLEDTLREANVTIPYHRRPE
jgi:hypothetical protein